MDLPFGYECHCHAGYRKLNPGSSERCVDVDECAEGFCRSGRCTNLPGSFNCECPPGFDITSDGKDCTDRNECEENGMCANGNCFNNNGGYECDCHPGFRLSVTRRACVDFDECHENPRICLNGRCENTPGSYRCDCRRGFTTSADGSFCVDMDECSTSGMCDHGRCINVEGSFQCICDSGYRLGPDGHHCIDLDECSSSPCDNGRCINTQGSFRCECRPGFNLGPDGRSCLDTRKDMCYANMKDGQCGNPSASAITKSSCCCSGSDSQIGWGSGCQACPQPGTSEFETLCPHGSGKSHQGVDINECSQNPQICLNGACDNLIGSYRCICDPGYEVDITGKKCTDVNECEIDGMVCGGGKCKNTEGSYQCICPTGTQLNVDTGVCEDIDECAELGPDTCINGDCVNTFGSFECECDPDYILDNTGRICMDNRRGSCWTRMISGQCENNLAKEMLKSECCCSIGVAWGSPCQGCNYHECDCPKGYAKVVIFNPYRITNNICFFILG